MRIAARGDRRLLRFRPQADDSTRSARADLGNLQPVLAAYSRGARQAPAYG